jgi:hypothetical protein
MLNCSSLRCENKFELPIKFKDSTLQIDLGRIVPLNILNLKFSPIVLPKNFTFPTVTLQLMNFTNLDNSLTPCFFTNQVSFTIQFNCGNNLGRILKVEMIGNITTKVGNTSTTNSITLNSFQLIDVEFFGAVNGK